MQKKTAMALQATSKRPPNLPYSKSNLVRTPTCPDTKLVLIPARPQGQPCRLRTTRMPKTLQRETPQEQKKNSNVLRFAQAASVTLTQTIPYQLRTHGRCSSTFISFLQSFYLCYVKRIADLRYPFAGLNLDLHVDLLRMRMFLAFGELPQFGASRAQSHEFGDLRKHGEHNSGQNLRKHQNIYMYCPKYTKQYKTHA